MYELNYIHTKQFYVEIPYSLGYTPPKMGFYKKFEGVPIFDGFLGLRNTIGCDEIKSGVL